MIMKKSMIITLGILSAILVIAFIIWSAISGRVAMNPPGTVGNTAGNGEALSQGAGGHVDARCFPAVTMAGQIRTGLIQGFQPLLGKEATKGQGGVNCWTRMPLGADQPVPILPKGIFRIVLQLASVQHTEQVCDGHAAADVPKAPQSDLTNGVNSNLPCELP